MWNRETLVKLTVGISDMKTSCDPDDVILTHSLGSCIGLVLYDPELHIGGLIHCMLPLSELDPARAQVMPQMFTDTGVSLLIAELLGMGADKRRLVAKVAGAAKLLGGSNSFNIGERNQVVLRKILQKNEIPVAGEDTGGNKARTLFLHMDTGTTLLRSGGTEYEL